MATQTINQTTQTQPGVSLLRKVLLINAGISLASAALMILGSGALAEPLGIPSAFLFTVGAALLPFILFLYAIGVSSPMNKAGVQVVFVGDVAWVVASGLLLASNALPLTTAGFVFIELMAAAVAVFAFFEWRGLRQMQG